MESRSAAERFRSAHRCGKVGQSTARFAFFAVGPLGGLRQELGIALFGAKTFGPSRIPRTHGDIRETIAGGFAGGPNVRPLGAGTLTTSIRAEALARGNTWRTFLSRHDADVGCRRASIIGIARRRGRTSLAGTGARAACEAEKKRRNRSSRNDASFEHRTSGTAAGDGRTTSFVPSALRATPGDRPMTRFGRSWRTRARGCSVGDCDARAVCFFLPGELGGSVHERDELSGQKKADGTGVAVAH